MNADLRSSLERLAPIIVDIGAILLYIVTVPLLVDQFIDKSITNAFILGFAYLILCASVFLLKRLEREEGSTAWRSGSTLAILGLFFGIMVAYLIIESTGFFEWLEEAAVLDFNNPWQSILVLAGVLLWMVFIFLYAIVLAVDIKPTIPEGSQKGVLVEYAALAGVNLMIIVAVASWQALFADTEPYEDLGIGAKIIIFLASYAFFLLFFAPPRLVYIAMKPRLSSSITFIIQTSFYVWQTLASVAW